MPLEQEAAGRKMSRHDTFVLVQRVEGTGARRREEGRRRARRCQLIRVQRAHARVALPPRLPASSTERQRGLSTLRLSATATTKLLVGGECAARGGEVDESQIEVIRRGKAALDRGLPLSSGRRGQALHRGEAADCKEDARESHRGKVPGSLGAGGSVDAKEEPDELIGPKPVDEAHERI